MSIGVSVDSNVVYFEHLKEDVKGGRTVRSAVERSFPIAYSTIVKANVASLIAAVVLYTLTVGQVRGFALFLGLATVLDLVATYFFMGPAIRILANLELASRELPEVSAVDGARRHEHSVLLVYERRGDDEEHARRFRFAARAHRQRARCCSSRRLRRAARCSSRVAAPQGMVAGAAQEQASGRAPHRCVFWRSDGDATRSRAATDDLCAR